MDQSPTENFMVHPSVDDSTLGRAGGPERQISANSTGTLRTTMSAAILDLYGETDYPQNRTSFPELLTKARGILRKRIYGLNKPPREWFGVLFPLTVRMRKFYLIQWIPRDVIAGVIVAMIHFTQVFGNAQTATLRPEVGLNILIFPGLMYAFMASSPHNSVGGMAITTATLSISLSELQVDYQTDIQASKKQHLTRDEKLDLHLLIAPAVALVAGILQIIMAFLKLGFLSAVLSPCVIEPFSIACFLQSICGKLPAAFGLSPPIHYNYGKQFWDIMFFFTNIQNVNGWEVLLSISMASIVLVFREYLQPRIFQRVRIVVPVEFLIFIVFTGLSYALDLQNTCKVRIVGDYAYGIPTPSVPYLASSWRIIWAGVVCAIVSYSTTLDSAKVLARKNEDAISPNQELLALGSAHLFGSFFSGYIVGAPMGRGWSNQAMGSRSQLSTLMGCLFSGLVIGYAGPAIKYLPICLVSTNMILFLSMSMSGFAEVPKVWRTNRADAIIWSLTFVGCIASNVQIGLFLGVSLSLLSIIIRSQRNQLEKLKFPLYKRSPCNQPVLT